MKIGRIIEIIVFSCLLILLIIFVYLYVSKIYKLDSKPEFFSGQEYILLMIFDKDKVVCQKIDNRWVCKGFSFVDDNLLGVVDFNVSRYKFESASVIDIKGLNNKTNQLVGKDVLK